MTTINHRAETKTTSRSCHATAGAALGECVPSWDGTKEQRRTLAANSGTRVYLYRCGTSVLPLSLTYDLFAVAKFRVVSGGAGFISAVYRSTTKE